MNEGPVERRAVRRALVSVYDKTGLDELAAGLNAAGVELVSTGSTAARIAGLGIPVTQVSDLTGFPECLDGRVKTLHPAVHAGILADQGRPEHQRQLADLGIAPFDLVVVNLYPFRDAVDSGADLEFCVEQIDIGGPAMVRAAAKNHASVAVVVSPDRYADVLAAVAAGGFLLAQRRRLAAEAFAHTAAYDVAVATWCAQELAPSEQWWPEFAGQTLTLHSVLRYGENPHQQAALYAAGDLPAGLAQAEQLHGKDMSFNNYVDADAARRAAFDQPEPCVAIIKHANPCGIAVAVDIATAHRKANECDPVSAFGGVVAANRPVTAPMAAQLVDIFTEVVVAPAFDDDAFDLLMRKKNVRLLRCPPPVPGPRVDWRQVSGGALAQIADELAAPGDDPAAWRLAAGEAADEATLRDLVFAWRACRAAKSNAILIATNGATIGIGMGQVNRVDAARLAVWRAGEERCRGAVAASDAFFPFPDGLEVLAEAGVRAVVQPGGSIRDDEVTAVAAVTGVTMYLTGTRHFAH